jgi:hypothetical protein
VIAIDIAPAVSGNASDGPALLTDRLGFQIVHISAIGMDGVDISFGGIVQGIVFWPGDCCAFAPCV